MKACMEKKKKKKRWEWIKFAVGITVGAKSYIMGLSKNPLTFYRHFYSQMSK